MFRVATPVVLLLSAASVFAGENASISVKALLVPQKARDRYAEGEKRMAKHDAEGARRKFLEAVALAPEYAAAWNALGVLAEDPKQAEVDFRRAFECDPDSMDAALNLGALLLKTGRADEAFDYNRRAAMELPNDPQAQAQFGMNLYQQGKLMDAERALVQVKRIDPRHASRPQLFLAEIYSRRGEKARAAAELEELLATRPDAQLQRTLEGAIARLR
ncbi:MAG: hypothetical protein RL328_1686 [Acidobacteriota bacterium]